MQWALVSPSGCNNNVAVFYMVSSLNMLVWDSHKYAMVSHCHATYTHTQKIKLKKRKTFTQI